MKKLFFIVCVCSLSNILFAQGNKGMVLIKGGEYLPLYSLDSQKVMIKSFYMDVYPVTNNDYLKFVQEYPAWKKGAIKSIYADGNYLQHWNSTTTFDKNIMHSPVVNVSWFAAKKYCACQGKRLATVGEWEVAARANQTLPDATQDEKFNQWVLSWLTKPNPKVMPPVGSTFRNYYGVYDLHGLVWEWTYDFNSALDNTLFCGGGSFASKDINNYASFMRFASRSSVKAKYTVPNLGFRCVK